MPDTMATFTRTLGTAGRSTIMEAGTLQINLSRTGKAQKIASNGQRTRVISNGHPRRAAPIDPVRAAITGPVKVVLTDQILIRKGKIWTVRPRTGHVVIFQASAPKASRAAGSIAPVAAEDLADSAATASVAAALDALADSVAAGSEADVNN